MQEYREISFVNTSRESQILQNMPNGPNSAPNAGLAKTVEKGQHFMTLDDDQLDQTERITSRVHFASK